MFLGAILCCFNKITYFCIGINNYLIKTTTLMKKLFTLIAATLFAAGMNAEEVDILSLFTYTWNTEESLVTNDDGSVTFNAQQWGGMAAWLAVDDVPADWSGYSKVVFEYAEPTTVNTQILVGDASAWGNPGITSLECSFKGKDMSAVQQIALQASDVTTITVKRVYLVTKTGDEPGPDEPKYVDGVLWEGSVLVTGWGNQPYVLSDGGTELKEAGAEAGDYLYFYASAPDENWQVQLIEGHWGPKYQVYSGMPLTDENGNPIESTIVNLASQGYFSFQLTEEVLATAFTAGGWGGSFLLNGDGDLTLTKVQLVKKGDAPAEAKTLFSWIGGADGATVTGGTITGNGADAESINYANSNYYTIRVSSKKASIDSDNITITLDEALEADDNIAITAYRNKDTDANGNLYILFENGTAIDEGNDVTWNNIHENVGQQPNTNIYTPGDGAGSKTIKLARSKSGTNVFIIKIEIVRGGAAHVQGVKTINLTNDAIYNLRGQKVGADYKGIVIRGGKKFLQK